MPTDPFSRIVLGSNLTGTDNADGSITIDASGGSGVDSIAKNGSTGLTGDVTLSEGANVTLTQVGQDIEIAATGGGGTSDWDTTITKSGDESVTSSTALQVDDHLQFATVAGGVYNIELLIVYTGDPAGDLKFAVGEDATARGTVEHIGVASADGAIQNFVLANRTAPLIGGAAATARLTLARCVYWGNGGTFALMWAQNASSLTATVVKAGSILRYKRLV